MKNVLILGATGRIGGLLVDCLDGAVGIEKTVYVRNINKVPESARSFMNIKEGDVTDTAVLSKAMEGQDIVVGILSGDVLGMAQSIAEAMKGHPISHVIWVTGLGIHHEVPGKVGKMLDGYVARMPEYVVAADTIAASGVPYTLVRAAHLTDGDNGEYFLQQEGEELHSNSVDRIAVAKFIAHIITEKEDMTNASIGITN